MPGNYGVGARRGSNCVSSSRRSVSYGWCLIVCCERCAQTTTRWWLSAVHWWNREIRPLRRFHMLQGLL